MNFMPSFALYVENAFHSQNYVFTAVIFEQSYKTKIHFNLYICNFTIVHFFFENMRDLNILFDYKIPKADKTSFRSIKCVKLCFENSVFFLFQLFFYLIPQCFFLYCPTKTKNFVALNHKIVVVFFLLVYFES
jgi:hypothetical protein